MKICKYWFNSIPRQGRISLKGKPTFCKRKNKCSSHLFGSSYGKGTRIEDVEKKMKIIEILSLIIPLLVSIAYLTLAERKIMGSMQRRLGPNKIGLLGVLQP